MDIPDNVEQVINRLEEAGHEAFAVGGCVRDTLMGREPEDWDITTSAIPEEVKKLFGKTVDTGIQHGTVMILQGGIGYEVTTYRIDGQYEDHRHPKEVLFTENLVEDLKRRDFTINAMAYNPRAGLIDVFHGREDLDNRVIRAVGDAKKRFSEDALRMFRAIRFAGQLQFHIEQKTKEGILELASTICHVSAERIRTELVKLLISDDPGCFRLAKELGLSEVFLPEWKREGHSIAEVEAVNFLCKQNKISKKSQTALAISALLHENVDDKQAHSICRRLTFDNDTIRTVEYLLHYYDQPFTNGRIGMRYAMSELGTDFLPLLLLLQEADCSARGEAVGSRKRKELKEAKKCFNDIRKAKEPISIKDLALSGNNLLEMGVKSGPEMGELLQFLMKKVLDNPEYNQKDILKKFVMQHEKGD